MEDKDLILQTIRRGIANMLADDGDDLDVVCSLEEQFILPNRMDEDKVYLTIRLLPATINFGQRVIPLSLNALSSMNRVDRAFSLLSEFALRYNLATSADSQVVQTYTTPMVTANFEEAGPGYHSVAYMTGTFLITEGSNPFKSYYQIGEDELHNPIYKLIPTITSTMSFDNTLDTQATFSGDDRTTSVSMMGTLTCNFTLYFTSTSKICEDAMKVAGGAKAVDTVFHLKFEFASGYSCDYDFRLVSAVIQKNVGEVPMLSLSFTR